MTEEDLREINAHRESYGKGYDDGFADGYDDGYDDGHDDGFRAGLEAMRERCLQACEDIILFSRSAEGIHLSVDMLCMRSHLLQAIRALEVE
jgi:flagellar biosynthesis/type III secretory pathway protein FliH